MNKVIKFLIISTLLLVFSKEAHGMRFVKSIIKPIFVYFFSQKPFEKFKSLEKIEFSKNLVDCCAIKDNYIIYNIESKLYQTKLPPYYKIDYPKLAVYDIQKKKEIWSTTIKSIEDANCLCLSKGAKFTAIFIGQKLIVYDTQNNKEICSCKYNNIYSVTLLCISKNGKLIALVVGPKVVIHNTQENKAICRYSHKETVSGLNFLKNGLIVSIDINGNEILYDIKNKKTIFKRNIDKKGGITAVCYSNNEKIIALGSIRKVVVYEAQSGKELCRYKHNKSVRALTFSKDSRFIASESDSGELIVYDREKKKKVYKPKNNTNWITHLSFTDDGDKLISIANKAFVQAHKTSSAFFHSINTYKKRKKQQKRMQNNLNLNRNKKNFCDCLIICSEQANPNQSKIKAFPKVKNIKQHTT